MSQFSEDAKLIAATLLVIEGRKSCNHAMGDHFPDHRAWEELGQLIAAAPAPTGDKVTPAEPTEEEWVRAVIDGPDLGSFDLMSDYCRRVYEGARHLAALRAKGGLG